MGSAAAAPAASATTSISAARGEAMGWRRRRGGRVWLLPAGIASSSAVGMELDGVLFGQARKEGLNSEYENEISAVLSSTAPSPVAGKPPSPPIYWEPHPISLSQPSMATGFSPSSPQTFKLILGSSSVARRHILAEMGFAFQVMTADIDEKSIRRDNPDELVMVLAEAKADAIMSRMNIADYQKEGNEPTLLITSDIVVVHEGIIREKPTTKEEARQFLKGYSGGHVSTVGSVVVTNLTTGKRIGSLDKAEVYFHDIPSEVIESLVISRLSS